MKVNEQQFIAKLSELKDLAESQGNVITEEQLNDLVEEIELDSEQKSLVEEYLKAQKIGIGEPVDLDEYMTDEDRHYINLYLEELEELPKLTDGEKEAYLIQAMAGDFDSRQKLIEGFLPQVVDIAKLYVGQGVPLEDLIGEGNVALTVIVDMLGSMESPKEAEELIVSQIMEAMESFIEEDFALKQEFNEWAEKANFVLDKAQSLSEELLRKVTVEEVSKETGLDIDFILDVCEITSGAIEFIELGK